MIKYTIYHEYNGAWFDGNEWTSDRNKAKKLTSVELDKAMDLILKTGRNVDIKGFNDDSVSTYKLHSKYNWTVTLEDLREGVGRVSIFIGHREFSYTWGAIGDSSIKQFILQTDSGYFCSKLINLDEGLVFSPKNSLRAIKRHISENYPYYRHMDFQKQMRKTLKKLETISDSESFFEELSYSIKHRFDYYLIDNRSDRIEVESFFDNIRPMVWEWFEKEPSGISKTISEIHNRLKKQLEKEEVK